MGLNIVIKKVFWQAHWVFYKVLLVFTNCTTRWVFLFTMHTQHAFIIPTHVYPPVTIQQQQAIFWRERLLSVLAKCTWAQQSQLLWDIVDKGYWGPRTWIPENQPLLRWPIRACLAPTHQQCKAVQPSSVDELKPPSFLIFSFQLWQIKENLSGLEGRNYGANCFDFIPFGVLKEKDILNNDSWSHPAHQDNRQGIQYRHKHLSYRNQSTHPSLQHWKECTHSLIHSFLGKRILCRQKSGNLIMRFCVLNHISACKLSELNALDCHQPLEW